MIWQVEKLHSVPVCVLDRITRSKRYVAEGGSGTGNTWSGDAPKPRTVLSLGVPDVSSAVQSLEKLEHGITIVLASHNSLHSN